MTAPILYTFRRCPYAMRARLALAYAGIRVELREILLKDKPAAMLAASSKATVPIVQLADGTFLDESLDIMHWALQRSDPVQWLPQSLAEQQLSDELIATNDGPFKQALNHYKYWVRFPERSEQEHRREAETLLLPLENILATSAFLLGDHSRLPDQALFPFIRQFSNVDSSWFESAPYPHVRRWLKHHLDGPLFASVMVKYPLWQADSEPLLVQFGEQGT